MKGSIFDVKRFAIHDGPGIRTTVFFRGCPLSCWWCHNPEGRDPCAVGSKAAAPYLKEEERYIGEEVSVSALMGEIVRDRVFYDHSDGGVTFSGGEPLMQAVFLSELLKECGKQGIRTTVDTSGYAEWEEIRKIAAHVDLFLWDIKIADDYEHRKYTGVSNGPILDNLSRLAEEKCRIWIRVPVIPGITDSTENLESIVSIIEKYDIIETVCLLPYNRIGEDKYRRLDLDYRPGSIQPQTDERMNSLRSLFTGRGFSVKIGG